MSRFYKQIEKAPLQYVTADGEYKKINVVPINNVRISNSFNIPRVRGAVGLFNLIISTMMYFATYDKNGKERRYPLAQEKVYLPAWQISQKINRCESQSYNVIRSLERIFDIYVTRANEKFGSNTFTLSERVYEFLHIFTYDKLQQFIEKYNISEKDQYALKQIYNYRVVRPSDKNLDRDREERQEFYSFIKNRKHRNFLHFCSTNNVTNEGRVIQIEANIEFLTEKQREQLQRIKLLLKQGVKKLGNYLFWKLIEIQQYVTFMINKDQIIKPKANREEPKVHSLSTNRNKTEAEQQKTDEVAAIHKKDPEPSIQDVVQVGTFWNIMSSGRDMEFIHHLSEKKIQSISRLVKYHGKDKVLEAIKNTGNLYQADDRYQVLKFKDFIKDSTNPESRFNKILRRTKSDTRFTKQEFMTTKNKQHKFYTNYSSVSHDNIPDFNSKDEAKSWFKNHTNLM